MNLKKILASTVVAALAATAMVIPTSAEETYKLGIGLTSAEWVYRDTLDQEDLMKDKEVYESDVEWVDTEITGDGTYTVEAKNLPAEFGVPWNLLVIRGNIPFSKDISVEIIEVESDSIVDNSAENKPNLEAEGMDGTLKVDLYNTWNGTKVLDFSDKTPSYIKVTFKLTGLGGSDAETTEAETTEAENNAGSDNKEPANTGIEGVAVVAGLAILATGAIVIAKKRK